MPDSSSPPAHRAGSQTPTADHSDDNFQLAHEWPDDDDDDMEFEPESEATDNIEYIDDDEDSDDSEDGVAQATGLFRDSDGNIQIELTMGSLGEENEQGEEEEDGPYRTTRMSPAQILSLLNAGGLRRILQTHGLLGGGIIADDDGDGYPYGGYRSRRRRANRGPGHAFPKVPSENGRALMNSGFYGNNLNYVDEQKKRKKRLATQLMWRELGIGSISDQKRNVRTVFQDLIPGSTADKIIHYDTRCYSGQFSDDGNFFFCCGQDFRVRMYDTSNPYDWKYYKKVRYHGVGQWTITDATLSPDNRYLAYSSIHHEVSLAPTDPYDTSDPMSLDFSNTRQGRGGHRHWGIWSLRFSGDGREIVAGTSDRSVIVYDLETRQSILRLRNHEDDVNAVCYGDTSSPHILYSGSDDTTIRVWDRRSMNDSREAGAFVGHTEGLTYVDSKGDGRYVLSNGKDQVMKLWDLRKMVTTEQLDKININHYTTGFDYRYMAYSDEDYTPHPHDCSVVTFRGHRVLKTLIRCHFSPPSSTNSRYVYSGSEDGKVYVYNMDATLAAVIDVGSVTYQSRPQDRDLFATEYEMRSGEYAWRTCVRDASWHPSAPVLAATSWNGWGMATGTCTVHSWNDSAKEDEGEPALGLSYDEELEYHDEYNDFRDAIRTRERHSRQPVPPYQPDEW
ncbi:WD40-repeat-containing domain protein [Talaromyces proteolyticus]|uniref:WD40-repeat-containing domain protein n=1 Tax=Talaromyces proteolyticus TaxID=1131652 RepID=A0AAD4KZ62_9EURO|nr:WD40-repeat-containing domain protein [Talaromyces proteolyticus]KAH8703702.1 WD40-repeat-containing domain protein [Talaromyces proteolyticus]